MSQIDQFLLLIFQIERALDLPGTKEHWYKNNCKLGSTKLRLCNKVQSLVNLSSLYLIFLLTDNLYRSISSIIYMIVYSMVFLNVWFFRFWPCVITMGNYTVDRRCNTFHHTSDSFILLDEKKESKKNTGRKQSSR